MLTLGQNKRINQMTIVNIVQWFGYIKYKKKFPRTSKDWNNLTFDPADAASLDIFTRKLRNDNA